MLVRDAGCNLFDEPLAKLDPPLADQLRTRLLQYHAERPTTTFYVTHDQRESLALASVLMILAAGRVRQIAPPLEIYRRPADRFVAGFFGTPSMQFCEGKLAAHDGRLWFEGPGLRLRLTEEQTRHLSGRTGAAVQLGLRPQAIVPCGPSSDGSDGRDGNGTEENCFTAKIRSSEVLGDRIFHRLTLPGGGTLIASENSEGASPSAATTAESWFRVNAAQAHFFAPGEYGANLIVH